MWLKDFRRWFITFLTSTFHFQLILVTKSSMSIVRKQPQRVIFCHLCELDFILAISDSSSLLLVVHTNLCLLFVPKSSQHQPPRTLVDFCNQSPHPAEWFFNCNEVLSSVKRYHERQVPLRSNESILILASIHHQPLHFILLQPLHFAKVSHHDLQLSCSISFVFKKSLPFILEELSLLELLSAQPLVAKRSLKILGQSYPTSLPRQSRHSDFLDPQTLSRYDSSKVAIPTVIDPHIRIGYSNKIMAIILSRSSGVHGYSGLL